MEQKMEMDGRSEAMLLQLRCCQTEKSCHDSTHGVKKFLTLFFSYDDVDGWDIESKPFPLFETSK